MKYIRKHLKLVAAFLFINTVNYICFPIVSMALTSGPSTPEASSFEPIEASDMVDLSTGDFSYTMPLIEVPGPSGGYPLALSYHAGISPGQEASWVGLGWNINPGAINRSVNGYADDWLNRQVVSREYWSGGKTTVRTYGGTFPIAGVNISAAVSHTKDTYRGAGFGGSIGVSIGTPLASELDLGVSGGGGITYDPVLGSSVQQSAGLFIPLSEGSPLGKITGGLSVTANHTSYGTKYGFSGSSSLLNGALGASISSSGAIGVNAAGGSLNVSVRSPNVHNSGKVSYSKPKNTKHVALTLLLPYSKKTTTYKIDVKQTDFVSGALYPAANSNSNTYYNNHDYDVHDFFELEDINNPGSEILYPQFQQGNEMMAGGTVAAYDSYIVSAQGIGGAITPKNYLTNLKRQNKKNNDNEYIIKQYEGGLENNQTHLIDRTEFAFAGFENKYIYDGDNSRNFNTGTSTDPLKYTFDGSEVDAVLDDTQKEYDNNLVKSRYIKWLSNSEIINNPLADNLISNPLDQLGFSRENNDNIGAYIITNPSGVTYYYTLPAHSYDEKSVVRNVNFKDEGKIENITEKTAKYAYTWHLTGITGPDYVDRGGGDGSQPNGKMDEQDWGRWIQFDYGLWADDYKWRTPSLDFEKDFDGNFITYARGKKEVYYLNRMRTSTHTVLFVKDLREDGKGLSDFDEDASFQSNCPGEFPTASLKLSEIILLENEELPTLNYSANDTYSYGNCSGTLTNVHFGSNVLLSENITAQRSALLSNTLKGVSFNTSYGLMPNTPNSFTNNIYSNGSSVGSLGGKLRLDAISFFGRNGSAPIPSIQYNYENPNEPFCESCIDYWGSYKSDYTSQVEDENVKRMPTSVSAQKADSWSLNEIQSPLGGKINIDYSADEYSSTAFESKNNFKISDLTTTGGGVYQVYMEDLSGDLSNYFNVGQIIDMSVVTGEAFLKRYGFFAGLCDDVYHFKLEDMSYFFNTGTVQSINSNYLVVNINTSDPYIDFTVPDEDQNNNTPGGWLNTIGCVNCAVPTLGWRKDYMDFLGGEVYAPFIDNQIGGGLKVDQVSVTENISGTITNFFYEYETPGTNQSSGTTTYIPINSNQFDIEYPDRYYSSYNGWYKGSNNKTNPCNGSLLSAVLANSPTLFLGPAGLILDGITDGALDLDFFKAKESLNIVANTNHDLVKYKRNRQVGDLLTKAQLAPSPGVMYEYVKVSSNLIKGGVAYAKNNYTQYQFKTFDKRMVDISSFIVKSVTDPSGTTSTNGEEYKDVLKRGVSLKSFSSEMGQVKSRTVFDKNGLHLHKTTNTFLSDYVTLDDSFLDNYDTKVNNDFNGQGIFEEVSVSGRLVPYEEYTENDKTKYRHHVVGVVTKQKNFPSIPIGTISIDYTKGTTTESRNLAFDYLTGATLETLTISSSGNKSVNQVIPAYKLQGISGDAYPEMNSKYFESNNKNMMSQEGAVFTYKVSDSFNPDSDNNFHDNVTGLASASIQTWSDIIPVLSPDGILSQADQDDIFRHESSYNFVGTGGSLNQNGFYNITHPNLKSSLTLNSSNEPDLTFGWQKNSEITLYDVYSHALEATDVNGNSAATKFDINQEKVFATAANAEYNQFSFCGIEDEPTYNIQDFNYYFGGNVLVGSAVRSSSFKHTGQYSAQLSAGDAGILFHPQVEEGRKYLTSFWSTSPEVEISLVNFVVLSQDSGSKQSNGWYQIKAIVEPVVGQSIYRAGIYNTSGTTAYVDDFRFQPVDAAVTAYVYNEWGELSEVLDNNNLFTRYQYDAMGRLKRVYKETFDHGVVKVSESGINYANQN